MVMLVTDSGTGLLQQNFDSHDPLREEVIVGRYQLSYH